MYLIQRYYVYGDDYDVAAIIEDRDDALSMIKEFEERKEYLFEDIDKVETRMKEIDEIPDRDITGDLEREYSHLMYELKGLKAGVANFQLFKLDMASTGEVSWMQEISY